MFEHRDPTGRKLRTYELNADFLEYNEGDWLLPRDEIGLDARSGLPVLIDTQCMVATVYYNPMNDSYLVMVMLSPVSEPTLQTRQSAELLPV